MPSVTLERDEFVLRDVNNTKESVDLCGIRDVFMFNVRSGSVGKSEREGFNFDVVVSNGADNGYSDNGDDGDDSG